MVSSMVEIYAIFRDDTYRLVSCVTISHLETKDSEMTFYVSHPSPSTLAMAIIVCEYCIIEICSLAI